MYNKRAGFVVDRQVSTVLEGELSRSVLYKWGADLRKIGDCLILWEELKMNLEKALDFL